MTRDNSRPNRRQGGRRGAQNPTSACARETCRTTLDAEFAALRADPPDPVTAVLRIADTAVALHADHPHLHALFAGFATRTPGGVAAVDALREDCTREVAFHLSRRPGGEDPGELARTVVHAVDGLLHHSPAAADVQRARIRTLARLLEPAVPG
ncbi:hypothetical protein [Pseudonocardia parietis]|uniref:Tetracyclin repressor SlmA-like C-terminal domain-containing protein n=1 Tax=Pseudonocardia parietis TaxID=570936 RepID=A0ABS4VP57_9PSEU|nr:hypothetical protein [Pseudonocardia parietis]MBP2365718.1 hypothetical protein [Pseudonocardia parietis]